MKVCLINTLYYPNIVGGAERSVKILADTLCKLGHEVFVVTLTSGNSITINTVDSIKVYYVPLKNRYFPFVKGGYETNSLSKGIWHFKDSYNFEMSHDIYDIVEFEKPDVVNTHNISGFSVSVWDIVKSLNYPIVHTLRDYYLLCPRNSMFKNGAVCRRQCYDCKFYSIIRKKKSNIPDMVTGISEFIINQHINYGLFDNTKKKVIQNAYSGYVATDKKKVKNLENGNLRFGFLGRLAPSKGIEQLIKAYQLVEPGKSELHIAGTGSEEYYNQLVKKTSSRKDILWLGFVDSETFFQNVDVLVVPSKWHEPMGRVVIEAYSYGIPVIGSNRGGIPELISKKTGWIFDPDDTISLRGILTSCIENQKTIDDMYEDIKSKANEFNPLKMATKFISTYEEIV